ncbi:hypothetical protein ACFQEX_14925 [Roseibium salinum]|uniref:hypothetical protein n=1 Tax=Roseibium salinum TaxID=1604349 RepID=UPI0036117549
MIYLLIGLILLVALLTAGRSFVQANPAKLAQNIRIFGGIFLIALAALFAFAGRVVFAIPLFGLGLSLLGLSGLRGLSGGYNPKGYRAEISRAYGDGRNGAGS